MKTAYILVSCVVFLLVPSLSLAQINLNPGGAIVTVSTIIGSNTNINNTFVLRYKIGGMSDIFNIGGVVYNITNISNACWTQSNITNYFSCSYFNNNFAGMVYAGSGNQFTSACFSNSTVDYTFNITSNVLQRAVIPLASGTCDILTSRYYLVATQGQPATSLASYNGVNSSIVNLEMRVAYPQVIITGGSSAIGKGNNKICVQKIGVQNNLPVVDIRRC